MRQSVQLTIPEDATDWSQRCNYWISESSPKISRRRRERETNPLILTGHGLSIRVDKGSLLVRDGYTHYPADRREWHFFNGELDIPPALIVIDGSGEITMDAIDWLATQDVPFIRLRWDGQFASIVTAGGQAASMEKVRWQERTRLTPKLRVAFGLELIQQKARNTLVTMEECLPRSSVWDTAYKNITTRVR